MVLVSFGYHQRRGTRNEDTHMVNASFGMVLEARRKETNRLGSLGLWVGILAGNPR